MKETPARRVTRRRVLAGAVALFAGGWADRARAGAGPLPDGLRLVFVEDKGCVYCRKWLTEVGAGYDRTPVGKVAPLVRRDLGDSALSAFARLRYTPTFLLVRDGRELDRMVGYAGPQEFWSGLAAMLAKAGPLPETSPTPPGQGPDASPRDT